MYVLIKNILGTDGKITEIISASNEANEINDLKIILDSRLKSDIQFLTNFGHQVYPISLKETPGNHQDKILNWIQTNVNFVEDKKNSQEIFNKNISINELMNTSYIILCVESPQTILNSLTSNFK
jgi:hypothetical protein